MRIKAFSVDYIIISFYILLLIVVGLFLESVFPSLTPHLFSNPWMGQLNSFLVMTLPVTIYFSLFESSVYQASPGKYLTGLRVIQKNGNRLKMNRAFARTAIKFIPWELAHACIWHIYLPSEVDSRIVIAGLIIVWLLFAAYLVSLLISKKRQTLYDQVTCTYIIERNK